MCTWFVDKCLLEIFIRSIIIEIPESRSIFFSSAPFDIYQALRVQSG